MQGNKALQIPPRWLHCPRKGELIANKFLPFKTPLDSRYNDQVPEDCRFDVDMFFASVKGYKIKVGLIVDLTNTNRFYNRADVERHDCKYVKVPCKGHGERPSLEYTQVFIDLCANFFLKDPLHVIGVHCTHGFNRSGLLIVSYLVQKLEWSADAAVVEFAKRRPPGIYKQDYLDELANRFADFVVVPTAPALPDWCTESDDTDRDDDGNRISESGDSDHSNGSERRRQQNKNSGVFMEGLVSGHITAVGPPQLKSLQVMVQKMCGWTRNGFPGAQPVSMTYRSLDLLSQTPYKVSWKADGTRYMMLIKGNREVYMVDRDNAFFLIPDLTFPRRKEPSEHIYGTLLDGEMIFDEVNDKKIPRYLIYDIIKFQDLDVGKTDFDRRLLCIEKEIISPRRDKMAAGELDSNTQPFGIRIKPFWDLTSANARKLLEGKFSHEVSHKTDGLIFQAMTWKYIGGRCDEMLKWKPADMNSVDFLLRVIREQKPGMLPETKGYLHVGGMERPFSELGKVTKDLMQYNGKIIECTFDFTSKQWKFMRQRVDKSFPNSFDTAKGVCESIERPVTKEMLYDFIDKRAWKQSTTSSARPPTDKELMPPPALSATPPQRPMQPPAKIPRTS